jgi:hypothetical protein
MLLEVTNFPWQTLVHIYIKYTTDTYIPLMTTADTTIRRKTTSTGT